LDETGLARGVDFGSPSSESLPQVFAFGSSILLVDFGLRRRRWRCRARLSGVTVWVLAPLQNVGMSWFWLVAHFLSFAGGFGGAGGGVGRGGRIPPSGTFHPSDFNRFQSLMI